MVMSSLRTRWAAIGAAIAVTLGAGGIGLVSATSPANAATFVPITPCRLFDTRPQFQVGDRGTPLGAGDIFTVTATGNHGNCTGIPTTATAVSMNMTSTDATAPTFLTVWAADKPQPTTSNMNPIPGSPATPNGVIAALSADGKFSTFNLAGTVHVVADINGYYTDHNHDDRYHQKGQVDSKLAGKANTADVYTKSEIDSMHPLGASTGVGTRCNADGTADGGPRAGEYDPCSGEITLGPTSTHAVLLVAQIGWGQFQTSGPVKGACRLERDGVAIAGSEITMGETVKTTEESNTPTIDARRLNWAGVTVVGGPYTAAGTYRVACREVVGNIQFNEVSLSGVVTSL